MNNRERLHAIMNYEQPDRMPAVHFGYTPEVLQVWVEQGHLPKEILDYPDYSEEAEDIIGEKLGFDFGWNQTSFYSTFLRPYFEPQLIEKRPDGFEVHRDVMGVYVLQKEGAGSIPAEVDHLLKDRETWEEHYLPRLQAAEERFSQKALEKAIKKQEQGNPVGLHCGSLCGRIRDILGIVGLSYMTVDDEDLLAEIFDTIGKLAVTACERSLATGFQFDYAHFWEDVCYKNGPLISPSMFREFTGPYYKKITDLLKAHNVNIVSVDCDGCIDSLIPVWLDNGVNTMFPIEVGTWNASIEPWRANYGKQLHGIGGMRKALFAQDYAAIDAELKRLAPMAKELGYIPCPDHRIPVDAKWENVQYYAEKVKDIYKL